MTTATRTLVSLLFTVLLSCGDGAKESAFQLPVGLYTVGGAYDVANNNDISDVRIDVLVSSTLTTSDVLEARLVISKASKTFREEQIATLAAGNFFTFPVSMTAKQIIRPAATHDTDGDTIVNGVAYQVYVAVIGKQETRQLSASKDLTLIDGPIYAGDYVGTWEDLGPPGPAVFPMSLRIADDYTGKLFYANSSFRPFGKGTEDATITMMVSGAIVSAFVLNQFITGYSGSSPGHTPTASCPAIKTLSGRFDGDVDLVLDTFNWADCDGTRDVKLKFTRQ
jgi:hypothetical protein